MKKILFVLSTLNTGGTQRAFSNIIMAMPDEWDIDILINDSDKVVYPYRGKLIDLGMKPEENKLRISYQIHVFIKRFFMLKKLKREGGYKACISALESANIVNVLTGKRYCRTIISIRCFKTVKSNKVPFKKIVDVLMKHFYNKADCVVAVSEGIAQELQFIYGVNKEKITTIYNGYNVEKIREDAQSEDQDTLPPVLGENTLVTSGRFSVQKGQEYLLRALKIVMQKVPDVKLVMLGEGELEGKLRKMISELDLEDHVFMPGFVSNPFSVMYHCKVFVFPSLFEGFPNALAEAVICGLPCVATDCKTGSREILAPKTHERIDWENGYEKAQYGILCPTFDTEDTEEIKGEKEKIMADGIIELLKNEDLYDSYKTRIDERACQLGIEAIVQQWVNIIEGNRSR